ncbi:MAG: hypothetical protein IKN01_02620 [Prevotella sp.]|nr:hypothetical protein [Prevotella sp.]
MMKKVYMNPSMKVVRLHHMTPILQASLTSVCTNLGLSLSEQGGDADIYDR